MGTAVRKFEFAHIITYAVASGQTVTEGYGVVFHTDSEHVANQGASSDLGIGVALESGTGANSDSVTIALFGPVVAVVVGTGGSTYGKKAIMKADGFADAAAHDSDNTGNSAIYGIFMETGIATNVVGMQMIIGNRGNA